MVVIGVAVVRVEQCCFLLVVHFYNWAHPSLFFITVTFACFTPSPYKYPLSQLGSRTVACQSVFYRQLFLEVSCYRDNIVKGDPTSRRHDTPQGVCVDLVALTC